MTTTDRQISKTITIITFPTSLPEGNALARVDLGMSLDDAPTWSIQTLNLGPARSSPTYDRHLRDTIGSSYDWSDELRFDKRTGRLASFVLKTPEAGAVDPEIAKPWLALPRQVGIPIIEDRENGFHVDPRGLRYLSEDASALVVTDANMPVADGESVRLAVAGDIDLLFHGGRYSGWILGHPTTHLVVEPGDKTLRSDDPRLHDLLREYLTLVVEPNITRMSDEEPEMREALQALCTRVRDVDGPQAGALLHAIERVLETFYPG
jgi:hypothetical protein